MKTIKQENTLLSIVAQILLLLQNFLNRSDFDFSLVLDCDNDIQQRKIKIELVWEINF